MVLPTDAEPAWPSHQPGGRETLTLPGQPAGALCDYNPRVGELDRTEAKPADRVASMLRQAILTGEVRPGDYIRQEKWAAKLNVSRLPVREALNALATEGLVTHELNKGYSLARLDVEDMAQVYLMRRLLEPELIKTVRWPTDKEFRDLQSIARRSEQALERGDVLGCLSCERRLSHGVYDLSRLKIVAREVKRLWELLAPYRCLVFAEPNSYYRGERIELRHKRILDSLERQDRAALQEATSASFDVMLSYFSGLRSSPV